MDIVNSYLEGRNVIVPMIYYRRQVRLGIYGYYQVALEEDPEDMVVLDALCILGVTQLHIKSPFTHDLGELRED